MQSYDLYLKGRGMVARRGEAVLLEGIDILKASVDIEPSYAPPMATMAKAYAVLPYYSNRIPAGEAREQARQWAKKALEIEPDNVEAMAVLAIVYSESDLNFTGAAELLEKALKLNPGNIAANNFFGDLYTRIADLPMALKYESRAAELDPLGPVQLSDLANVRMLQGDYAKVIQLANRALSLNPTFANAHQHLVQAWFALGDAEQLTHALQVVDSMPDTNSFGNEGIRLVFDAANGNRAQAEKTLEERARLARNGQIPATAVAFDATIFGDFDIAGELLLQAYREKDGTWLFPIWVRLPEQAPDSEPWQEFWRQPGVKELAELRRRNGLDPHAPNFGSGAKP